MIDYIEKLRAEIDKDMVKDFDPANGILESAMHYALSVKGKRLRPLLFLTLIEAYGLNPMEYLDIASAVETIHTYSLIHDDLPSMDNDDFRRGMPTVHKQFNEAIALLAGDTLLTYAFERIAQCPTVSPGKKVEIFHILTQGIGKDGMAGGQALDLEFKQEKEKILKIHHLKTAALIRAVLLSAAAVIGLDDQTKRTLSEIGTTIGAAFQLTDDLLDIEGNEKEVGKKLNKDQLNLSPNAVLFFGMDWVKNEITCAFQKTMTLIRQLDIRFQPFLLLMENMVYRNK